MWFAKFLKSSIGKKYVMAATGLLLVGFLFTHAFGNANIYIGSKAFQAYSDALHGLPLLVFLFSLGLFVVILAHVVVGLYLFYQNRQESVSRYAVTTRVVQEKNSLAARTMPYSGLYILLFLLVHVSGLSFSPEETPISATVRELLGGFFYGLFYLTAFFILALHLSHGFWSLLQTFGLNHPRYNGLIRSLTFIIPLFFLTVFGGIPLYFMTGLGNSY